jgi:hypothetical protein
LPKGFPDHYRIGLMQPDPFSVSADEYMRYRSGPQYRLYGRNAASLPQARIDDHQVRLVLSGGNHSLTLGCRRRADLMAHVCEKLPKQQGN